MDLVHDVPPAEKNLLLNLRRDQRQVHDLRDSRPRQPGQPGDLGVVLHDAIPDEALEVMTEDEEEGDPRRAGGRHGLLGVERGLWTRHGDSCR